MLWQNFMMHLCIFSSIWYNFKVNDMECSLTIYIHVFFYLRWIIIKLCNIMILRSKYLKFLLLIIFCSDYEVWDSIAAIISEGTNWICFKEEMKQRSNILNDIRRSHLGGFILLSWHYNNALDIYIISLYQTFSSRKVVFKDFILLRRPLFIKVFPVKEIFSFHPFKKTIIYSLLSKIFLHTPYWNYHINHLIT